MKVGQKQCVTVIYLQSTFQVSLERLSNFHIHTDELHLSEGETADEILHGQDRHSKANAPVSKICKYTKSNEKQ